MDPHNDRVRLLATALNNLGVGAIIVPLAGIALTLPVWVWLLRNVLHRVPPLRSGDEVRYSVTLGSSRNKGTTWVASRSARRR
jgi:hypothetical protein